MRFMGLLRADEDAAVGLLSQKLLENMETRMDEVTQAGILLTCNGLQPSPLGARVKLFAGKVTVTDCPLTEVKSRTIPCAMFEVDSIMEAVQWTACFLQVLGEGECEIRPL